MNRYSLRMTVQVVLALALTSGAMAADNPNILVIWGG